MSEFISQKENLESLLLFCMYCDKYKNDTGYWEQKYGTIGTVPETRISHGLCPECFQEHFPVEYLSLCEEGKIVVKQKTMPNNKVLYVCFYAC